MKTRYLIFCSVLTCFFAVVIFPVPYGFCQSDESDEVVLKTYHQAVEAQYLIRRNMPNAKEAKDFGEKFWSMFLHPEHNQKSMLGFARIHLESQFEFDWSAPKGEIWLFPLTKEYAAIREEIELESIDNWNFPRLSLWSPEELPKYAKYFEANEKTSRKLADLLRNNNGYFELGEFDANTSHFSKVSHVVLTFFERAATQRNMGDDIRYDYLFAGFQLAQLNSRSFFIHDWIRSMLQSSDVWMVATNLLDNNAMSSNSIQRLVAAVDNAGGISGPEEFIVPIQRRVANDLIDLARSKKCTVEQLIEGTVPQYKSKFVNLKNLQDRIDQIVDDELFWSAQKKYVDGYFGVVESLWNATNTKNYHDLHPLLNKLKEYRTDYSGIDPNDPMLVGKIVLLETTYYARKDWLPMFEWAFFAKLENQVRRDLLVLAAIVKEELRRGNQVSKDLSVYKSKDIDFGLDPFTGKDYQIVERDDSVIIFSVGLGGHALVEGGEPSATWHDAGLLLSTIDFKLSLGYEFSPVNWAVVLKKTSNSRGTYYPCFTTETSNGERYKRGLISCPRLCSVGSHNRCSVVQI